MRGQQPETDEAVSRIEFDSADLGREEDQAFAVDVGSESLSATLCLTKTFSEYLVETIFGIRGGSFGKAYTSQVLPFGKRVMYKYTSVPTGNLDQDGDMESGLARRQ